MSDLRSLIEAAKADAPTAAARSKVWAGVSGAIAEAAAATGVAALAGSTSAMKMLAIGTLLGGTLTVGIGAALLFVGPPPQLHGTTAAAATAVRAMATTRRSESPAISASSDVHGGAPILEPSAGSNAASARAATGRSVKASSGHAATTVTAAHAVSRDDRDDALAREASLLASARSALSRSDALSALQMVRSLRALPAAQLMPEELAVEAQALRALGLSSDADQVDATLRTRFPDSVLGR